MEGRIDVHLQRA